MIPVMCVVQEGQISPERAAKLGAGLAAFTQRSFGAPAAVNWIEVAKGHGFTAGAPSTSAVVTARSNRVLDSHERTALLHELCDLTVAHTSKTADELVLVVLDPQN